MHGLCDQERDTVTELKGTIQQRQPLNGSWEETRDLVQKWDSSAQWSSWSGDDPQWSVTAVAMTNH